MRTLSEHASKALLAEYGVPIAREALVSDAEAAAHAAERLGFPVVVKLCGDAIAHKTERSLVRLGLGDAGAVRAAAAAPARNRTSDGPAAVPRQAPRGTTRSIPSQTSPKASSTRTSAVKTSPAATRAGATTARLDGAPGRTSIRGESASS